jgi:hypothetical protein
VFSFCTLTVLLAPGTHWQVKSNAMALSNVSAARRTAAALVLVLVVLAAACVASAAAPGRKLGYQIHVNSKPGTSCSRNLIAYLQ